MEDDSFFADLSKQISLLIAEEEDVVEKEPVIAPYWHYASSLQGFDGSVYNLAAPSLAPIYHQINCRREISKGTGVFIPMSSQPRRKNRQGKFNSSSRPHRQGSDHRQHHHQCNGFTRSGPPQLPHKTSFQLQKF
ncbi:hypothetical protein SAY87_018335 [Trapa incisa]|uniref:Uncharacterized protein n=2 Tax=Trapa TaxID=22665 RepID=A0AAN7LIY1_TRANT|nr:hypothetical protein SAY87_018335 [Trapa incisa]KAK4783998.1 hypothetical protein SAY86_018366 [Trapa natans]